MRKQIPPRDLVWIDAQGRPTEIFFEYIKNLESRSLGQSVVIGQPVKGQFVVYSEAIGAWTLQPATAPADGEVLIYDDATDTWIPGTN